MSNTVLVFIIISVTVILTVYAVIRFIDKTGVNKHYFPFYSRPEKKEEPEPSIMTELDELRRSNERLSTTYEQLAYDHDVLDNEHKKLLSDFLNAHKSTRLELLQSLNDSQSQSYNRMIRITELEKELSNLRSSCDDSFLNTIERANKLSMKCASLENTIAEFDVYKKDAQEVHDKLIKLYESEQIIRNNLSSKLWRSRREVASLKRDLISATAQIAELGDKYRKVDRERNGIEPPKERKLLGWVAQRENGTYSKCSPPFFMKYLGAWVIGRRMWSNITPEEAMELCGRLPKWSDDEPTPIYE